MVTVADATTLQNDIHPRLHNFVSTQNTMTESGEGVGHLRVELQRAITVLHVHRVLLMEVL